MIAILVLSFTVVLASANSDSLESRQFGLCVEECTPGGTNTGCPHGYLCLGTGCGHVCQIILPKKRACHFIALCDMLCLYGQKIGPDGCPLCECNESPW